MVEESGTQEDEARTGVTMVKSSATLLPFQLSKIISGGRQLISEASRATVAETTGSRRPRPPRRLGMHARV